MVTRRFWFIVLHEMKVQSRDWIFRFFALLSVVGIVFCHWYWQGQGQVMNWKMVALPCSFPLMNSYLYSVLQSLFLPFLVTMIPARLGRSGSMESICARPWGNGEYLWGMLTGIFLLMQLLNIVVAGLSLFLVHMSSMAEVNLWYYLFYWLTLNIPCWFVTGGLSLWLTLATGSRWMGILIPSVWWLGCLFFLPGYWHGTLDFLASGVPNLFSDMIGHVNLENYLLHRCCYFLLGVGLLLASAGMLARLPNGKGVVRCQLLAGFVVVLLGVSCLYLLEEGFYRTREARRSWVATFDRYWREETCRVREHEVRLEQKGKELLVHSRMLLYNPGQKKLDELVLFLNPGLELRYLASGGEVLPFRRDGQVIIVERELAGGDSLRLVMDYGGRVDTRFCDLHLRDGEYENVFGDDNFFPTGRQGAFVEADVLLLPPASVWYPVAIPPVNPLVPLYTGRDFTRFSVEVVHPLQQQVFVFGRREKTATGWRFETACPLHGLTVYGMNGRKYALPLETPYGLYFYVSGFGSRVARLFKRIPREVFAQLNQRVDYTYCHLPEAWWKGWCGEETAYLSIGEVPLSYRLDSHPGKTETGLVERGIVFFREDGFDMNIAEKMQWREIRDEEQFRLAVFTGFSELFDESRSSFFSHPLWSFVSRDRIRRKNDGAGSSLGLLRDNWVFSENYPFAGKIFENWQNGIGTREISGVIGGIGLSADLLACYDALRGNSLNEILVDKTLSMDMRKRLFYWKTDDLWVRLSLEISVEELEEALEYLRTCSGELSLDSLAAWGSQRWGVNVGKLIDEWYAAKHEQYFKVRDMNLYFNKETDLLKAEATVQNAGKEGGIVGIEYGNIWKPECLYSYLGPGEIKKFSSVSRRQDYGDFNCLYFGLSANRPLSVAFEKRINVPLAVAEEWREGGGWTTLTGEKMPEMENEYVVDDSDAGFTCENGGLTLLQRWFPKPPAVVEVGEGKTSSWAVMMTNQAYGDSIRGFHVISGGKGNSFASWEMDLPEAGQYRLLAKVYKCSLVPGPSKASGVINYYTVFYGDREENLEIDLDAALGMDDQGWISLGLYDCPKGKVRVRLSNKEVAGRDGVGIVADAVKWVKVE